MGVCVLLLAPPSNEVADVFPGKSDPFVVFTLNDQKVHKSQTKKKTLSPEWNESFTVQVVCVLPFFRANWRLIALL